MLQALLSNSYPPPGGGATLIVLKATTILNIPTLILAGQLDLVL